MTGPAARVLVTHPGRQHSHQAAMALERAGLLAGYWAGIPAAKMEHWALRGRLRRQLERHAPLPIPAAMLRWLPVAVALRRLGRSLPRGLEQEVDFLACRAFDRQVAGGLRRVQAAAVVACEISALATFREARRLGMRTILDAASFHYAVQDQVTPPAEPPPLHARINRVKQAEIELADHVLTVSELARSGYIEAGLPASRVHAVTIGADVSLFQPPSAAPREASQTCTFLFAGATIHRKGVDLLAQALSALHLRLPGRFRLVVVGPRGDSHYVFGRKDIGEVLQRPSVSQAELREIYQEADCLVLPSRHDSFGMVVLEAMACGVPAIVSDMVGAREAVEEGVCGWVVPMGDAQALAERLAWCVEHRGALAAMRPAARTAAERYSWDRYAGQLEAVTRAILDEGA